MSDWLYPYIGGGKQNFNLFCKNFFYNNSIFSMKDKKNIKHVSSIYLTRNATPFMPFEYLLQYFFRENFSFNFVISEALFIYCSLYKNLII
jgi:hypothetical protein